MHEKNKDTLFTIGEVRKITNIPHSAIRYYCDHDLITPAYVDFESGYRYFSNEDVQKILVLKFYQSIGFNLDEISGILKQGNLEHLENAFQTKIDAMNRSIAQLQAERDSVEAWRQLVEEAKEAILGRKGPQVTHIEDRPMYTIEPTLYKTMDFYNLLINHDLTAQLYSKGIITVGPLFLCWKSIQMRKEHQINQQDTRPNLMIEIHPFSIDSVETTLDGGYDAVVCYHVGAYENLNKTYAAMEAWAQEQNLTLRGDAIERYVIDPWSTSEESQFVTEIILPIQ